MARYLIGIDLGTTNSALAFIDLAAKARTRVLDRFTLAQSIQAYRDLYERITDPELATAEHPALTSVPDAAVPRPTGRA